MTTIATPRDVDESVPALVMERRFSAPVDRVFDAWANSEHLAKWMGPGSCVTTVDQHDLTPGGAYRWIMEEPDGQHIVSGEFIEVDRPTRLSFTWMWEFESWGAVVTVVELAFSADGDGTRMVLTHTKLPSGEALEKHEEGWTGSFDKLDKALGG